MNHPTPRPPKDLPAGFFRFTRWCDDPDETFPAWRAHFAAIGVRVLLIRAEGHVALFREGEEAVTDVTSWRLKARRQGGRISK